MLSNFTEKCKIVLRKLTRREDLFLAILIFLVGFGSFGLGRLSVIEEKNEPVRIYNSKSFSHSFSLKEDQEDQQDEQKMFESKKGSLSGGFVASVNGSKYHFPWCPSAGRIKEENKIWFANQEEAKSAGYEPAKNCPGLISER